MKHPESRDPRPWTHDAVDLDHVPEAGLSREDGDLDAQLARLVSTHYRAVAAPPSRIDLAEVKRRAAAVDLQPRWRRTRWVVAGAVAAAAAVVAVVVLGGGLGRPVERQGTAATEGGGSTTVPLRAGVPGLPADEVTRLEALQDSGLRAAKWPGGSLTESMTPLDCDRTWDLGVEPAVLDGLDPRGLRQQCAAADQVVANDLGTADVRVLTVFRFYVPEDVSLDDVTGAEATADGVSWTEVSTREPVPEVTQADEPKAAGGGVTTVAWGDALASVHREGPDRTAVSWVDPYGRSDRNGSYPVAVRAVVAADPVLAVRAAVGFRNQGDMQVLHGDDGSLLLVPTTQPRFAMEALASGTLTRTPEGCLGLDQGEYGFQLVLWPYRTRWDPASEVLTIPGDGEYRLGQELRLGGGESEGVNSRALVPPACAQGKTWIASSDLPLEDTDGRAAEQPEVVTTADDDAGPLTADPLGGGAYAVVGPKAPDTGEPTFWDGALIRGQLAVLGGGCLGLLPDTAVVWPAGTTPLDFGPGVRLPDGRELRAGDQLEAGGGYYDVRFTGRASGCPSSDVAFVSGSSLG